MTTIGTHAPLRELRDRDDQQHDQRRDRADRVDARRCAATPFCRSRRWWRTMPVLRQRERREHADRVERDQRVRDAAERARAGRRRRRRAAMMPFENTSRSPRFVELARQVAVLGDDRRQAREAVVRGVRREHEDRGGRELQEHEQRPVAEHLQAELRDHRALVARVRLEPVREHRDAEEQRAEQHAHPHERRRGVLRLRAPERGHAVRDRLDAGERDRARREALQQEEDRRACRRTRSTSPRACWS